MIKNLAEKEGYKKFLHKFQSKWWWSRSKFHRMLRQMLIIIIINNAEITLEGHFTQLAVISK